MIGVLLAEDEAVVCLDLEDALTEAGLTVLGSFSHCAADRAWLDQNTPDVALLGVMLADGRCIEIARVLARRGIPPRVPVRGNGSFRHARRVRGRDLV